MSIVTTDSVHYETIAQRIREHCPEAGRLYPHEMPAQIESVYGTGFQNGIDAGVQQGIEIGYSRGLYEGIEQGKSEGKIELLQDSEYMNVSLTGEVVSAFDVSPVEHNLNVRVSSDTVTDLSQVRVSRYGKNLFSLQDFSFTATSNETSVKDNVLTINYTTTVASSTCLGVSRLLPNYNGLANYPVGTYTFYAEKNMATNGGSSSAYPYLEIKLADGTIDKLEVGVPKVIKQSFQPNALKFLAPVQKTGGETYITTLQVVCGESSGYEPFVEPTTYDVMGNGGVPEITSLAPSMTLVADTQGVEIGCSYLRDIDTYIDNLMMNVALTGGD